MIRHIALLLNFLIPGLGSLLLSKWRVGLSQFALWTLAILALSQDFHAFFAVPIIGAAYAWGLYTAEYSPRTGRVMSRPES